jgi:uncharacterized membrane protein
MFGDGEVRVRRDDGQLLPLYAVILLVACGAIVVLGHLGQLAHRRARVRTAADAAALAGAAEGRAAAEAVAEANGAVLDAFVTEGADVDVVVHIGDMHATARAQQGEGCRQFAEREHLHFQACQPTNRG